MIRRVDSTDMRRARLTELDLLGGIGGDHAGRLAESLEVIEAGDDVVDVGRVASSPAAEGFEIDVEAG